LKNTDISSRYICNTRKEPIASFRPEFLAKCYHIEEGSKRLDGKLLSEFEYTLKDFFPKWYKVDKQFKYRPKSWYPTSALRRPYQYLVAMLCRLYEEFDATIFPLSYMPLIYFCADVGTSFNWANILSKNLMAVISTINQAQPGQKVDTEVTKSMEICSRIHKASQELIKNGRLPRLDELGKNPVSEELVNAVHDNTNHRKEVVEATTFVSTCLIDQHLL
jgi:hypothetical protein